MVQQPRSFFAFITAALVILMAAVFYYPKWKQPQTEATLSWDVSGYYLYLPAIFIYKDLKQMAFADTLLRKYEPAPGFDQAFRHEPSGNLVLKYSTGQALQFLPGFAIGHLAAKYLGQPQDGFSAPYQTAIAWWGLFIALVGLWVLRKILLRYYSDGKTAATLLLIVLGSNYLNYSAFDGAMTHNWLFTLYALLIYFTIKFYEQPNRRTALLIGLLCGWATLTRPTEIISVLIPLLWIPPRHVWKGWRAYFTARFQFLSQHFSKIIWAAAAGTAVISIQFFYWKYTAGEWLVYSYGNQSFSWLRPHLHDGLLSYRAGWLVYSPAMVVAVLGWLTLWKTDKRIFPAAFLFLCCFMYITWAWDIWWYGGSLWQRAMVQSYPVWAFAIAAFFSFFEKKWAKILLFAAILPFIWFNFWITHQAHRGGLFVSEQMTKAYFWKILGKSERPHHALKLLDNKDEFEDTPPPSARRIFQFDYENDSLQSTDDIVISGSHSGWVGGKTQFSEIFSMPLRNLDGQWLRAHATVLFPQKEWDWWRMTQFVVRFKNGEKTVKENMIRVHRLANENEKTTLWLDAKFPKTEFDTFEMLFWNADGQKKVFFDDLAVDVW